MPLCRRKRRAVSCYAIAFYRTHGPPPLPSPASSLTEPAALPRADNALRGIILLIAATLLFSISDITAKYVSATLPVVEVAWFRYAIFVGITLAPAARHGIGSLRSRKPGQQILRGVAVVASALMFVMGLQRMPIADCAAINFVAPLFITVLSVPFLGEQVGFRRWAAVGVGLLGAVVAAQPGTSAFQVAAVFPVASALAWAIAIVLTRKLSTSDRAGTTLAWSACSGFVVLTVMLPMVARMPTGPEFAACLLIGVAASAGQSLVVLAYRHAPASLLAPFSYLQLIWSTLFGVVVFAARPGAATITGAVIIAASGLYAANEERKRAPRR